MYLSFVTVLSGLVGAGPTSDLLDQHDLVWEKAPSRWLDGIPLGNGHIGAMVWAAPGAAGEVTALRFTLDRYDAWETRGYVLGEGDITYRELRQLVAEGKREEATQCLMELRRKRGPSEPFPTRLPLPRMEISFGAPIAWEEARLSLRKGTLALKLRVADRPVSLTVAAHADGNAFVLDLQGELDAAPTVRIGLDHLDENAKKLLRGWGYPEPAMAAGEGSGSLFDGNAGGVRLRRGMGTSVPRQGCADLRRAGVERG